MKYIANCKVVFDLVLQCSLKSYSQTFSENEGLCQTIKSWTSVNRLGEKVTQAILTDKTFKHNSCFRFIKVLLLPFEMSWYFSLSCRFFSVLQTCSEEKIDILNRYRYSYCETL